MFVRDLARYGGTVWGIQPERLAAMLEVTGALSATAVSGDVAAAMELARGFSPRRTEPGSIRHIQVSGTIEPKASIWTLLFGGAALDVISQEFASAVSDPNVAGILMEYDSPGGSVYGVPEFAAQIRAARGIKPILSHVSPQAASAAYYLASQGDEVSGTPSGQVGSIGVVYLHMDLTGLMEKDGVKFQIFRSQERKADVNPYESLSAAAAADIQAKVTAYDAMFVRDVALGRGVSEAKVRSDYGAGRMFLMQDALKAGLVDRIETIEEAAARLASGGVAARAAAQASEELAETTGPIEVDEATQQARSARLVELLSPRRAKGGV